MDIESGIGVRKMQTFGVALLLLDFAPRKLHKPVCLFIVCAMTAKAWESAETAIGQPGIHGDWELLLEKKVTIL